MSKVAKYRRQVSEDPDIDSLLSTLSPEEMEELEKELDVVDPDGNIPLELSQKNQTENSPPGPQNCDTMLNHCEKETRKRIQREHSIDVSHNSPRLSCFCEKGVRQGAGPGTPGGNRVFCEIPVLLTKPNPLLVPGIFSLPLL
ncbi:unnamed protein product [Bubo scandiacus]